MAYKKNNMQVYVAGRRNYKTRVIECQIWWTIQFLGLENSKCDVTLLAKSSLRKHEHAAGLTGRRGNMIGVAIDSSIPFPYLFTTVAHEMIHVKQLAKGQLVFKDRRGGKLDRYWMGKKIAEKVDYYDLPWEIEAFSKSEIMGRRFSDALLEKTDELLE